jgi:hypothetical protein
MISALDELKAAGRLAASVDAKVWADAFWATLHGIVALHLTCPVFPSAPLDTVVGIALDTWLGAGGMDADADPDGIARSNASGAVSRRKRAGATGAQSSSQDNAPVKAQAEVQSKAQDGPDAEPAATRRRATKKTR